MDKKERLRLLREKRAELEDEISRLHIKQHTIKILVNSCYGYTGNKRAALGDDDLASSTTLTGQAVIKQSNNILRALAKEEIETLTDKEEDNFVVYNDTDSVYITLAPYIGRGMPFLDGDVISKDVYELTDRIEDRLNQEISKWGAAALNSNDCRLVFKRERS